MSLITCPECQREVSSKAPTCPHCGVKIAGNVKRCPVCNGFALMDAEQCPSCKTRFVVNHPAQAEEPAEEPQVIPTITPLFTSPTEDSMPADQTPPPATEETPLTEPAATTAPETADTPADQAPDGLPTPPKKGGGTPWWLLILGILLIAIGGFFYWENMNQEEAEEQAYGLLENCNDPLNYEDFIARFPSSKHIEDVRARLQELQREDAAWLEISSKLSAKELQDFVDQHPTSPYRKAALQKIDSIDWREADRRGTAAAYDAYINKHDNGEFLDQAFSAREAARAREERARRDSIAAAADTVQAAAEAEPAAPAKAEPSAPAAE